MHMGSFTGKTVTLADHCKCVTQLRNKKLPGKVDLNFLSSEIVVCYSQIAKYSEYRKLNY